MNIKRRSFCTFVATGLGNLAVGCGPPCPTASPREERAWEKAVDAMVVLPLDAKAKITIKRDVHNIVISAEAGEVANAFQEVMRDRSLHFGFIEVRRKRANWDKPFQLGERFQGHYSIPLAAEELPKFWRNLFKDLYEHEAIQTITCEIENGLTSDYGEITLLDLDPAPGQPYRMQYKYLGVKDPQSGSPISGSSMFLVTPIVDVHELDALGVSKACTLTQIFEYQEQTDFMAYFFSAGGLTLHNQVVFSQASQAAKKIGAKILSSDIPKEYQEGL